MSDDQKKSGEDKDAEILFLRQQLNLAQQNLAREQALRERAVSEVPPASRSAPRPPAASEIWPELAPGRGEGKPQKELSGWEKLKQWFFNA